MKKSPYLGGLIKSAESTLKKRVLLKKNKNMIKSESSVRPKAIVSTTSSYRGKYAAFSSINNIQDTGFIISKKLLAEDKGYKNALRKIRATEEVKLIIP